MASEVLTGCVKWFNHNLNYGFVTVLTEGKNHNVDIFVHQSNIKTKNDCYRTLSPGECVQFEIAKSDNTVHPIHAINVTGFNGGMLNCESARPRNFNGGGDARGGRGGRGARGNRGGRGGREGGDRGGDDGDERKEYRNYENNFHNRNDSYSRNTNFTRQPYTARNAVVQNTQVDSDIVDSVVITSSNTSLQNDITATATTATATTAAATTAAAATTSAATTSAAVVATKPRAGRGRKATTQNL
jgi:cold shock CspA family protein